jgi:MFS family permease
MYRWVIVGTAFIVIGMSWGMSGGAFGAFVTPLTEDMGWSRTEVSAAASINIMFAVVVGIFWGWLSDRWSVRGVLAVTGLLMGAGLFLAGTSNALWQMYIFYGFVAGVGLGGTAGPLTAITARWFPQRPGLAIGIVYAGFGAASALLPVLAERLISLKGWGFGFQGLSFLVWGAFLVGVILLREPRPLLGSSSSASQRTGPEDGPAGAGKPPPLANSAPAVSGDVSSADLRSALRTRAFWTLFVMMMAADLVLLMILVHLVPRAIDAGISSSTAVTLLTVTGLVNMVSTIMGGVLGDRFGARRTYLASSALLALSLIWLTASGSLWMFYAFAVAFGVGNGGSFPQIPVLVARIFGPRHMGSIIAAILLGSGVGGVIGPLVAGYVFETTDNYRIAFVLAAGIASSAVLLAASLTDRPRSPTQASTARPSG